MSWITDFRQVISAQPCVLVTLNLISGSAPRESGSRMIVSSDQTLGSIGGGNLEFQAAGKARRLLETGQDGHQEKVMVGLGPELNQCCGGAVVVLYEVFRGPAPQWIDDLQKALDRDQPAVLVSALETPHSCKHVISGKVGECEALLPEVAEAAKSCLQGSDAQQSKSIAEIGTANGIWWLERFCDDRRPVVLFGAGHVGQAVARALAPLPFRVTWVDSREGVFPDNLAANIKAINSQKPAEMVAEAEPGSIFIVMSHSHQLDEDICLEILLRDDFSWLGLIGSATKRRRFVHRLAGRGIEPARLDALICPIGLSSIRGKQPATIALSLAAQLMTNQNK